jgi:phosphoglycerol transferase
LIVNGWSSQEDWGTWTIGRLSSLRFRLKSIPNQDLSLHLKGHPFLTEKFSEGISIRVNGVVLYKEEAKSMANHEESIIKIPKKLLIQNSNKIELQFEFSDPHSPAQLKISNDPRLLGYGLISLYIN